MRTKVRVRLNLLIRSNRDSEELQELQPHKDRLDELVANKSQQTHGEAAQTVQTGLAMISTVSQGLMHQVAGMTNSHAALADVARGTDHDAETPAAADDVPVACGTEDGTETPAAADDVLVARDTKDGKQQKQMFTIRNDEKRF